MSRTPPAALASSADLYDVLRTARRARSAFFTVVLLVLLSQIGLFCTYRFAGKLQRSLGPGGRSSTPAEVVTSNPATRPADAPTTQPGTAARPTDFSALSAANEKPKPTRQMLKYLVGISGFVGVASALLLTLVLVLILDVMVVGRTLGLKYATAAVLWSIVLLVLLFPWQAFLISHDAEAAEFKVPGVLYSFNELDWGARPTDPMTIYQQVLYWSRWLVAPAVSLVILIVAFAKSSRAVRYALGELVLDSDDHGALGVQMGDRPI
jgi:hypothetical protein